MRRPLASRSAPTSAARDELRAGARGGVPAGQRSPSLPGHPRNALRLRGRLPADLPLAIEALALGTLFTVTAWSLAELAVAFATRIPA